MATAPSLLHSSGPPFFSQFRAFQFSSSSLFPHGNRHGNAVVSVKASASGVVLVEKSEAEKANRLKTAYTEKIIPLLMEEFSYTNKHQVPKIEKIVVNCGIGDAAQNAKGLDAAISDLALITGQRPIKTRARASLATLKIREGQPLGIAVTLRGNMMYSFLDRVINLGLPRTRDFQGVNPNSFDGHGNYSIGIKDQGVFPEIRADVVGKPRGMDICIVTTANTDQEAQKLLALMGMPFREGSGPATTIRKKKLKSHHFDAKSKGRGRR
ncbi:50S ribosomal protein L5, chloroplastic-like [Glycine max]|uniref:Large ribosomal subunit protein uL5c n=1 Tax=Glycine max TaxID=3847 RepID=C6TMD0_SOYBN|nr:50S ribosomal protein L5, chloroplastic-like [Glycine max]ACU24072.1 unknown [Glycine max]|eukprot:NP_001276281.1 50S ribosomal protein L5, chloroplastic-like [Glycine max]